MKTLKTIALICVLSVPALAGIIDAPCPTEGCAPPQSEPTLQERVMVETITGLVSLAL